LGALLLPPLLRAGRENAGAQVFLLQRPLRMRGGTGQPPRSDNEFLDTWVERCYLVTAEAFPTTQRTSRVTRVHRVALNPIEVAVLELSSKTLALLEQAGEAARGADRGAPQAFSQTLSGCVDAAVAGGVANYAPFFTGAFMDTHPEIAADLVAERPHCSGGGRQRPKEGLIARGLSPALAAHVRVLEYSTAVHAQKCCPDMLPLHAFLEERLKKLLDKVGAWGIGGKGD
jgi:dedicator of cytokinesis protein 3